MDTSGHAAYAPGVTVTQVPLPGVDSACLGLLTLGVIALDEGWRVVRHLTVMAHEGAHAVAGTLLCREFRGITLNRDATGAADIRPTGGPGDVVISFSGYIGPSMFGVGAARLIQLGHIVAVLWVTLFLLAVLLLSLRMSFGRLTVVLAGGLVFLTGRYTPTAMQVIAAYVIAWLLLLSGVRRVLEVGTWSSDGAYLRDVTHLPRFLWFLLWLAGALAAVAVGGKLLLAGLS
jgi:Peptidase M50B-like